MKGTRAYRQTNQSNGYNVVDFYFIICFCCLCSPFALCIMSTCAYACERCSCQLKSGNRVILSTKNREKKEANLIMPGASFCFWRPSKEFSFHYFNVYVRFIWTWTRYVAFSLPVLLLAKRIILPKSHTLLLLFYVSRPKISISYHTPDFFAWLAKPKHSVSRHENVEKNRKPE